MTQRIDTFETGGGSRTLYVQPSERDDETRVHVEVVRTDSPTGSGTYHTEALLTEVQTRELIAALWNSLGGERNER